MNLTLLEPTEAMREAYVDFVNEFHATDDSYIENDWEEAHKDFAAFVRRLRNQALGLDLPEGWVPASSYWLACEGRIVGTCALRHRLTEPLKDFGGNIGYGVRPSERRKGFATFMLRAMLEKAKAMGIGPVLVTCDARNAASIGVIKKCCGIFDSESFSPGAGRVTQRYWFLRPERP
jgi:predicted acetyltransferase